MLGICVNTLIILGYLFLLYLDNFLSLTIFYNKYITSHTKDTLYLCLKQKIIACEEYVSKMLLHFINYVDRQTTAVIKQDTTLNDLNQISRTAK